MIQKLSLSNVTFILYSLYEKWICYVREGQFLYHKTGNYVLRKEPADWNQPFWEHFEAHRQVKTERPDMAHYYNRQRSEKKTQTKLLESEKVKT